METQTLYRPVNKVELDLIQELDWKAFPPRLPEQPIFYPVMNQKYASQITTEWNLPSYGNGFVTKFSLSKKYLSKYKIENVGGEIHNELWIPAEELPEFNNEIIGDIEVVEAYTNEENSGFFFIEDIFNLTRVGFVVMIKNISQGFDFHITKKSTLNDVPLKLYLDKPRKLDKEGNLMTNIFVLRLENDKQINKLKKRTVVLFKQ